MKKKLATSAVSARPRCIDGTYAHRTRIEEPNGPGEYQGVCSRCGSSRMYKSWPEDFDDRSWNGSLDLTTERVLAS